MTREDEIRQRLEAIKGMVSCNDPYQSTADFEFCQNAPDDLRYLLEKAGGYEAGREAVSRRLIQWLRSSPRLPVEKFAVECERELAAAIEKAIEQARQESRSG